MNSWDKFLGAKSKPLWLFLPAGVYLLFSAKLPKDVWPGIIKLSE